MKTGVVDVGGGLRGIYAAGVLDRCMDEGVSFDVGIGVSAGSANMASFAAGQRGRNYHFYAEYPFRKQYMSVGNFVFKHSFVDLDYVYSTLSNADGENPLDYAAFCSNPMDVVVVATDAETGEPRYFTKDDVVQDRYDILKASSALPLACHPYEVAGRAYYDGALADSVPIRKAFEMGCDKVVLILTKPEAVRRTPDKDEKVAAFIRSKHPKAAQRLCERARRYNESVDWARDQAKAGRVLIVSPDDACGVDTLTKDKDALDRLYQKGYHDASSIAPFLQGA